MRIGCSSQSFHREIPQNFPLLDFPAWCGSQGIFDIEVMDNQFPSFERAFLEDFKRACTGARVNAVCLALSNDFTMPDANQRFSQIEQVRFLLYDVASPLKIPLLRVFMGMADTSKAGDQRALETFRGLVPDLQATGISMALENHGRVQTTGEQTAAIVAGVNSPFFGSCPDFGAQPADSRLDMLAALTPLAKIVHARSYFFNDDGEETSIDYKASLAILTEYGYDEVISIVYDGQGDPQQHVLKTKALIEKYWYHPAAGTGQMAA